MCWYKMESLKIIDYLHLLALHTQGDQCKELWNEVLMWALAAMIKHLKHTDDVKFCCWWQPADFEWLMQNKKGLWINNHMLQILNNDFDVFSLFDFHYWPLVLVPTAGAGCTLMLTTTSESHCSQSLESMITPTSTMSHRQQAFISESAFLAGLSLDSDQGQESFQIPSFHNRIENWSQSSTGGTRGQKNHRRHPWEESDHSNYEQRHKESSSDDTADDEFVKSQANVASSASTEMWQHAETWQTIQIFLNHKNMNYY